MRIERDADYGELVTIDRLPDLIMAIAFSLVRKPERLTRRRDALAWPKNRRVQ